MAIDYNIFYTREKGAAYKDAKIVNWSYYKQAVDHSAGRLAGNSRIWGDASIEVQKTVINRLVAAGRLANFNDRRVAMLLAMVKIESGFNPDAAAGTTSASGLGQFINKTGAAYGLNDSNRFEVDAGAIALVKYFIANEKYVKKNDKPDVWVYKYHHDGPTGNYGGEALATGRFSKFADLYEKSLNVGHELTINDPSGKPISDAFIKIEQDGKSAVLKTNEKGVLPPVMAHPDKGELKISIQKASEEFKEIGRIAIKGLESAWTVIAPKQRFAMKTHVHESHERVETGHTHKVKKGETLSRIAFENEITYQELAKFNNIAPPYMLHPQQILKIPEKKASKATAKPTPAPAVVASPKPDAPEINAKAPAKSSATTPTAMATTPAGKKEPSVETKPLENNKQASTNTSLTAATPQISATTPVVKEKRSTETKHPEAQVIKPEVSDKIRVAIDYALTHKVPKSIGYCLKFVKRALVEAGFFHAYPGVKDAKDFGPILEGAGFKNLLLTNPGINLKVAPIGAVIVYRPVEKQYMDNGKSISGHIEIKCAKGYISDYLATHPTYSTDEISMSSPINKKYHVKFKVIGIWYKDE